MGTILSNYWDKYRFFREDFANDQVVRRLFRDVSYRRGDLHGYLGAVAIQVKGIVKETEAAADLPYQDLWGALKSVTLRGLGHEWHVNEQGISITLQNILDEICVTGKQDEFALVDIPSSTDPLPFLHTFVIPICPKKFSRATRGKGAKDGLFPLAGMGDRGELNFELFGNNEMPGNWEVDELEVNAILHQYWTEDRIIGQPWRGDFFRTQDSIAQFARRPGKADMLFAADDDFGAFAIPTGNVKLEADGLTIQDNLNGLEIVHSMSLERFESLDNIFVNGWLPVIAPTTTGSMFDDLYSELLKLTDANNVQQGDVYYFARRYLNLTPQQISNMEAVLDIAEGQASKTAELSVGGRPITALARSPKELSGVNVRVK